jgi:CHAT domain-containing protein
VLHLATHATIEGDQPAFVLADGALTAGAIVDARLHPGVVVAASCASGMTPGREAWGALATSFLASGSTVIASRWSIGDADTRADMSALYRAGITDPIRAVATVQRGAIAAGRPVSTWAAYVVIGRGMSP